jgi:hypothetical protein
VAASAHHGRGDYGGAGAAWVAMAAVIVVGEVIPGE